MKGVREIQNLDREKQKSIADFLKFVPLDLCKTVVENMHYRDFDPGIREAIAALVNLSDPNAADKFQRKLEDAAKVLAERMIEQWQNVLFQVWHGKRKLQPNLLLLDFRPSGIFVPGFPPASGQEVGQILAPFLDKVKDEIVAGRLSEVVGGYILVAVNGGYEVKKA